jgi:integrase
MTATAACHWWSVTPTELPRPQLAAAEGRDRDADRIRRHVHRRAVLSVLCCRGLRIDELLALRWQDVNLASGWLGVPDAKTPAGICKVKLRGAPRDELATLRADAKDSHGTRVRDEHRAQDGRQQLPQPCAFRRCAAR